MQCRTLALTAASCVLCATAALADSPLNFAYRDAKGNIHDFHFEGHTWQKLQLNNGGMTKAPIAMGDPSAFAVPRSSLFTFSGIPADHRDFSYVGEKGDIHHIVQQGGKWTHEIINNAGATSAPPAAGPIAAMPFNREQLTYTFRDQDGNLQSIASHEGSWHAYRLNNGGKTSAPLAAGDPSVLEWGPRNFDVVYRDVAGGVQHLFLLEGEVGWKAEQLNLGGLTEAPPAAGDPFGLHGRDQQLHYAYRDLNGNLHHLYGAHSKWHHEQLNNGGATTAPLAAGDPAGAVHLDGQLDYVYRDTEGWLQRLVLKEGKWSSATLNDTGLSGVPPAASEPWLRCAPCSEGEATHVFFLDGPGDLQHLTCLQGKWSHEVVNRGANVTMAIPVGPLKFY